MHLSYPFRTSALRNLITICLASVLAFSSCQKNKTAPDTGTPAPAAAATGGTARLLSVANVYYTTDGRNAEAWFFETPLVFEFSKSSANAQQNFDALQYAKDHNLPVNVTVIQGTENMIDRITPASADQIEQFKTEQSKRVPAETVPAPDDPNAPSFGGSQTSSLTAVIPNLATLNSIFSTIKSQCNLSPGVLIYGPRIPFQFVADGCYARAHKMRQLIESYFGYQSYKVFNYACNGSGTLSVKATLWGNNCCVKWWYHVTSYVYVQSGTSSVAYAIDPAMFNGPVSISSWVSAQKNVSCGYGGTSQGQVYYYSNAYAPNSLPNASCSITPYADNTYTAADATCISYGPKKGCSF
jgi:Glutaminase